MAQFMKDPITIRPTMIPECKLLLKLKSNFHAMESLDFERANP